MVNAGIKRRLLKISIVKSYVIDEIDLKGCVSLAYQNPHKSVCCRARIKQNSAEAKLLQYLFDLIPEIIRLIDKKIQIVGIAMVKIVPAERCPTGEIKRRIRPTNQRHNRVHERVDLS
jgi:hypothetical protein